MQIRAKLFVDKFGSFDSTEYICWINRCSHNYKKINRINVINDQGAFTDYLAEQEIEGEYL